MEMYNEKVYSATTRAITRVIHAFLLAGSSAMCTSILWSDSNAAWPLQRDLVRVSKDCQKAENEWSGGMPRPQPIGQFLFYS
jgi:hypothetical protein